MTVRRPIVAGLTPGAGTSTLAAALHGHDGGTLHGRPDRLDVLVCRCDERSLWRVGALATEATRPVLALALDPAGRGLAGYDPALRARLGARFGGVVVLPGVPRWRDRDARAEAAVVLGKPGHTLSRPLRTYAAALRQLTAALLGTGALNRATAPLVVFGRPAGTAHLGRTG